MPKKKAGMLEIAQLTGEPSLDLALDTMARGKQAFVFVSTKRSAEATAEKLAARLPEQPALVELSRHALRVLPSPTKQCERLARVLRKGVAFHHAGLAHHQREIVERSFRSGLIKIIACTPTLAFGVDLPAFRAIIRELKRFSGYGAEWIPVLEFLQMAGRAGRPRYDAWGEAIAIAGTKAELAMIKERYILGSPEALSSKLAAEPVLRHYVLALIATELVTIERELHELFGKTFWAAQFGDMVELSRIVIKVLYQLQRFGFVTDMSAVEGEFVPASELLSAKRVQLQATKLGRRVSELYIDPLTAHNLLGCLKRAGADTTPFAWLQAIAAQLELRPLLRVTRAELEDVQARLEQEADSILLTAPSEFDPEYDDWLAAAKTALFLEAWINETSEATLLERFRIRPGEIAAKVENADWLLYACTEFARLLSMRERYRELAALRLRVAHGVREELLPLVRLPGIGRVRARRLFRAGIRSPREMRSAPLEQLAALIGPRTAAKLKQELQQKRPQTP